MGGKEIPGYILNTKLIARNWDSGSKVVGKLNQPYKDLCVESVIRQCGNSFNVCLINDRCWKLLQGGSIIQIS